jgi:hypothetical protein
MLTKCNHAGYYDHCKKCRHSVPHICNDEPAECRRHDGIIAIYVKCVGVVKDEVYGE